MLKSKLEAFYQAVEHARTTVGESPAKIADVVIPAALPQTYSASMAEGCDDMLRAGVIKQITRYITKPPMAERQGHFNEIAADLLPLIEPLSKSAYLVPSQHGADFDEDTRTLGFYVPIVDLVNDIVALRAARDFLSMKAGHVQSEADKLSAVILHIESRG